MNRLNKRTLLLALAGLVIGGLQGLRVGSALSMAGGAVAGAVIGGGLGLASSRSRGARIGASVLGGIFVLGMLASVGLLAFLVYSFTRPGARW